MPNELVQVPFHGDTLEAVQDERGVWASLRRMCEALGLDFSRQLQKLKAKPWATVGFMSTVAADGKGRDVSCLHLDSVPMWLATIEPSRVKPEVRPKLELYQKEAARVLAEHFVARTRGLEVVSRDELRELIAGEVRAVLLDFRAKQAEPLATLKERMAQLGWLSASPRQRDQVRRLALVKIQRHGYPRPDREGLSPAAELLFPASVWHLVDEAVVQVWEEARYAERGGMFDERHTA